MKVGTDGFSRRTTPPKKKRVSEKVRFLSKNFVYLRAFFVDLCVTIINKLHEGFTKLHEELLRHPIFSYRFEIFIS
jgi:hypothetical protein